MRALALLLAMSAGGLQALGPASCCLAWTESGCTCCFRQEPPKKCCGCPCHSGKTESKKAPEKKCSKGHANGLKPAGSIEAPPADVLPRPFEVSPLLLPASLRLVGAPGDARDASPTPPPTPLRI